MRSIRRVDVHAKAQLPKLPARPSTRLVHVPLKLHLVSVTPSTSSDDVCKVQDILNLTEDGGKLDDLLSAATEIALSRGAALHGLRNAAQKRCFLIS